MKEPYIVTGKDVLIGLLREKNGIYMYGAGGVAEAILGSLSSTEQKLIRGALVSDVSKNPIRLGMLPVMSVSDASIPRDTCVILSAGSGYQADMLDRLEKLGYRDVAVLSMAFEEKLLRLTKQEEALLEKFKQALWRVTPHPMLDYLVINVVDHCNLNCAGCDHFSPLADKREVPFEHIRRDVHRLRELMEDRVGFIWIMGGEPLLHPELEKVVRLVREEFPQSDIAVMSNGILLADQSECFWQCLHETSTILQVTKYPIKVDYDKNRELAKKHGVRFEYYAGGNTVKTLYHIPLDPEGNQDPTRNFMECFHVQRCCMLANGRLYPCTVAPNIPVFNKFFGKEIPLGEYDGIDIFAIGSGEDLLEKLARPMPVCRYCNVKGRSFGHEWRVSERKIDEWT